ncbi:MAG: translation initiation factor IF-2 [Bacteroidales bacterium]
MAAKEKRLIKIAKEFNIGHNTIVEFLAKKGFEIVSNPNTKVPAECYELLEKEFGDQISVKEKSKAVSQQIKDRRQQRAETKHDEATSTADEKSVFSENTDEDENIIIKDNTASPSDKTFEDIKEADKTKEETTEYKEKPKLSDKKTEISDSAAEKNTAKSESEVDESPKSNNLNVIRKIDLDKINQKTRPDSKKKKEQKAETLAEQKTKKTEDQQTETTEKTKPADTKEEELVDEPKEKKNTEPKSPEIFEKTKVEKLNGPKVVGKINIENFLEKEKELERKRKKEKEAFKAERKKKTANKKKRKRIKKEKVSVKDKTQGRDRDKGNPFPEKKKAWSKAKDGREEITEEDVQKQIKETLARMETKKQKSKTAKYRRDKRDAVYKRQEEKKQKEEESKNILQINEFASVNELASMMNKPVNEIIATCMNIGLNVSINQRLDAEIMRLVADEFGYDVEFVSADDLLKDKEKVEDTPEDLEPRAPIVTVMGHVDHGKTKLLDYIRHTNVVAGEAGKITQHIGAYSVELDNGKTITFLDTPGHEAFTAMRARGAQATDVAIIVIAADDDVMPQTVEAINHASAAGVPMVFAINKIDKPAADPEKIKEKLANMNYLIEDWGGKYQSQEISALQGTNVDELLEKVLLEAELLDLKANPNCPAEGTIIESSLDKGRGYVSTMLVQRGTLKKGDIVLAGQCYGRVKAMFNERQKPIKETGPATPAVVLGLNGAPQAGDPFKVMESESEAKIIAQKRQQLAREQSLRTQKHITLDEIGRRLALGNFQEINVVVKGDVDGSIEAMADSLIKLSTEELQVNVIHKAVGQITDTDVMLASASNAVIIGFQVRPSVGARKLAEKEEIEIRLYSIIYDAINDMKDAMEGMLSPKIKEKITGTAEVKEVFKITKVGTVAGCKVVDGKIFRNNKARVIRDGIVVYTGELESLKRFKNDVKEVASGYECGLNVQNFNDVKVGDVIESFEEVEVKQTLK